MSPARYLYRSVCQVVAGTGILYAVTSFTLVLSIFLQLRYSVLQRLCPIFEAVVRIPIIYTRSMSICPQNFSMAGIAFNLLLIRVGQRRSDDQLDIDSR